MLKTTFASAALLFWQLVAAQGRASNIPSDPIRRYVRRVELLGNFGLSGTFHFMGTTVGGISGLAFDDHRGVYYALSDDTSNPRFYTLTMELDDDGHFGRSELSFKNVTFLKGDQLVPEGIAYVNGKLYISSEGIPSANIDPSIKAFNIGTGDQYSNQLTIPEYFCPRGNTGARPDGSFKGLTISPDGDKLWTAVEYALNQDGPVSGPSRMLKFDLHTGLPLDEFVYERNAANGLVALIALDDDGTFLSLERNPSSEDRRVELYQILTQGSLNVRGIAGLADTDGNPYGIEEPVSKTLIANFDHLELGANYEAMAMQVSSGKYTLFLVSNNELSSTQPTMFTALEVNVNKNLGLAEAEAETPQFIDDNDPNLPESPLRLRGEASDPAVWVHPDDPSQSLVIGTLSDGGLATFTLAGNLVQRFARGGDQGRLVSVVVLYAFAFGGGKKLEDIIIITDNDGDSLVIFSVDRDTRSLMPLTSGGIPQIFPDDISGSAFGIAAYTSPYTGEDYVFVSQSTGDKIRQLRLFLDSDDLMTFEIVRTLQLPNAGAAAQARGLVVDREIGDLYIATEKQKGILRTEAEPYEKDTGFGLVENHDDPKIQGKLHGLTIYYGGDKTGEGYLIVSSEGDSSFFVYERKGDNDFVGRFAVTRDGDIDDASRTVGITAINVNLGPEFPCGLFVAQDAFDEAQQVELDSGTLQNIKSNFKLVAWEEIADSFSHELDVNSNKYGPRRFALVVRLDDISEAIFKAFIEHDVSARDAEDFLFDLDEAAVRLYKAGTRRRRMFSPLGRDSYPRGKGGKSGSSSNRALGERKSLRKERGSNTRKGDRHLGGKGGKADECHGKGGKGSKKGKKDDPDYHKIEDSLEDFIDHVKDCADEGRIDPDLAHYWIDCVSGVIKQLPYEDFTPFPTPTPLTFSPTAAPPTKPPS